MKTVLIIIGVILLPAIIYLCALLLGLIDIKLESIFGLLYKKSEIDLDKIIRYIV